MTSRTLIRSALVSAAALLASTNAYAGLLDLSGGVNICATSNGAEVCSARTDGSTGSGTFPAFVGAPGGRPDQYFMYNTAGAIEANNEVGNGATDNVNVSLGDFAVTNRNGTDVFTFVLDINQTSADPLLNVNHVSIFLSATGALTGYTAGPPETLGGVGPVYALAAADDILLNFANAPGSGRGDMFLYVPVSLFGNAAATTRLQLFSSFGNPNNNNDGFEEWSYLSCTATSGATCYTPRDVTPVPEPGTLALFGLGLAGLRRQLVRRRARS